MSDEEFEGLVREAAKDVAQMEREAAAYRRLRAVMGIVASVTSDEATATTIETLLSAVEAEVRGD